MIDRYKVRPKYLEKMVLVQFAFSYYYVAKLPKNAKMTKGYISERKSDKHVIGDDKKRKLPMYIDLSRHGLGYMKLRKSDAVLRFHKPCKKDEHEQIFTEMQLFSPWTNEDRLQPYSLAKCVKEHDKRSEKIMRVKNELYPGENMIDIENYEIPKHIRDQLDNQGEQDQDADAEEGIEDDPEFSHLCWDGLNLQSEGGNIYHDFKYKATTMPTEENLKAITMRLVPEQRLILDTVIEWCKRILRQRKPLHPIDSIRLIVH